MTLTIKLSSGKILEVTPEELQEILRINSGIQYQYVQYPVQVWPLSPWSWYSISGGTNSSNSAGSCCTTSVEASSCACSQNRPSHE